MEPRREAVDALRPCVPEDGWYWDSRTTDEGLAEAREHVAWLVAVQSAA